METVTPQEPSGTTCPPPTRWGICSAGKISHDFLVALRTLPAEEHLAVAVAARELSRAQQYAQLHGVARAYGSYEELARDPEVDVVYVGTVNPQHLPDTLLFLRARKAVLVEKPMGISAREAKEMAAAAREAGVFLMEGFWTRFFPAWKRLKALVDEGALGECRVLQGALAFPLRSVERVREPSLAGGALLDLGGYALQMASALLGRGCPPLRLRAEGCLHPSGKGRVLWGRGGSHWGERGPHGVVGEAWRGLGGFYGWVCFFLGGGQGDLWAAIRVYGDIMGSGWSYRGIWDPHSGWGGPQLHRGVWIPYGARGGGRRRSYGGVRGGIRVPTGIQGSHKVLGF
uniref:Trans-1,2-dihydrobenzene-1,2-diol dehydrogenase n=1 Tax=Phasianus colchicus TaxID=9054 RepID=A0A669QUX1_PHACC